MGWGDCGKSKFVGRVRSAGLVYQVRDAKWACEWAVGYMSLGFKAGIQARDVSVGVFRLSQIFFSAIIRTFYFMRFSHKWKHILICSPLSLCILWFGDFFLRSVPRDGPRSFSLLHHIPQCAWVQLRPLVSSCGTLAVSCLPLLLYHERPCGGLLVQMGAVALAGLGTAELQVAAPGLPIF